MNIIFGPQQLEEVEKKYTVLELDTLRVPGQDEPITAYCVVKSIPIMEMAGLDQMTELHSNLIKNYRKKNWKYCEDAIEHLVGKWGGELDSFYDDLSTRIKDHKSNDLSDGWSWIIDKTHG